MKKKTRKPRAKMNRARKPETVVCSFRLKKDEREQIELMVGNLAHFLRLKIQEHITKSKAR